MSRKIINKNVTVTAVYFKNSHNLDTYPKRIEFDGRTYNFGSGIRYLIKTGDCLIRLFDMTDGATKFRLRQADNEPNWTLVAITE